MRLIPIDGTPAAVRVLRRALGDALAGSGATVLPVGPGQSGDFARPDVAVEQGAALVVRTSGSTGTPKGVLLSAAALRASAEATHRRLGGPGTWLLALPAQHIAGAQVVVRSIMAGTDLSVMAAGGFRGRAFAEAASDVLGAMGPRYTSLVPTQLTRLLDEGGDALAALRAFDAVLVGGAATSAATLARAREAGVRVVTTYGMSETAGGCVYDGAPLDGVRVRIVDGLVHLGGPTLALGYRLDPTATASAFVDGWFRTSDLGRLHSGTLEILGRADDVINTGGVKIAAAAVERVLTGQPGIADACVVGLPDPEWGQRVAAVVSPSRRPHRTNEHQVDETAALAAVRAELGPAATPRVLRVVAALPLCGPGKIDRAAVAKLLADENR
ncbi:o-succinylbenzoate--CoA ligase [Actinokineospora iranica]|uniref:O-succinylbenzoic acid--CoA ligase n=1 Tax=Actinokineospora iranica TaxID=1271860 RepID=A0A1G6UR75_9PSEU|nr:o-succinylbenzoate--CoA ligase [Actinokineospora iranica]SDD43898.1 O-succinylbenzoic acid--CoA ligase [Actinokineospora iranica]